VVRLKHRLRQLGLKRLEVQDSFVRLQFAQPERLDLPRLVGLLKSKPDTYRLFQDQTLRVRLPQDGPCMRRLQNCLKEVETFVNADEER
jgi:transcription-repair coupling factor (superfamily II helicase)